MGGLGKFLNKVVWDFYGVVFNTVIFGLSLILDELYELSVLPHFVRLVRAYNFFVFINGVLVDLGIV